MFLSFFRIIRFSIQDITRNLWLSLVTIIILILALFSINMLLVIKLVGDTAVNAVKEKVDINLYIRRDANEKEILALKRQISNISEVKEAVYTSKEMALSNFKKKNINDPKILQALAILKNNPLTPSIVIKPKNPDNTDILIAELNKIDSDIIESRNFESHQQILSKIKNITKKVNKAGIFVSIIFIIITLLVVYNAIRVAIFTHNREITIMRLVGASNAFIYMPFLLSALIYTLIGILAVIALFYSFLTLLQPYLAAFFIGYNVNLLTYFTTNFYQIFGYQFIGIAFVNVLASYVAIHKYAKV